jgi:hypothetical protein
VLGRLLQEKDARIHSHDAKEDRGKRHPLILHALSQSKRFSHWQKKANVLQNPLIIRTAESAVALLVTGYFLVPLAAALDLRCRHKTSGQNSNVANDLR